MPPDPLPRYPVYIPSKGRAAVCYTAQALARDGVPFSLVVEAPEVPAYQAALPGAVILPLPFVGQGLIGSRNWIKAHATATGAARHWQLDDNMRGFRRWYRQQRIPCHAGVALRVAEDFADRYTNVAVAGLNYTMFAIRGSPPFTVNCHVYSCSLVLNALPYRWRLLYNDDTDYCLQALAGGWCTVLIHAFMVDKLRTMNLRGGNTAALYQGDGRLKMARALERMWPGVVTTDRRFKRPQHVVKDSWRHFTTPLQPRPDLDLAALPPDEYGLTLTAVRAIQSPTLQRLLAGATPPPPTEA